MKSSMLTRTCGAAPNFCFYLDNFCASYDEDRITRFADNGGVINEIGKRRQDECVASLKEARKTQLIGTAPYPMLGMQMASNCR